MIKLKPRMIQECKCEYCGRKYRREASCQTHEDKCYSNPNRNCPMCSNTGYMEIQSFSPNFGVSFDTRECDACKIAMECKGKSYIEKS